MRAPPGDRDSTHRHKAGRAAQTKGPRGGWGRRARVRAGQPQAGIPPRDRCGRAEEGGGYGPPRPGSADRRRCRYPPYPGPARPATPSPQARPQRASLTSPSLGNSPRSPLPPRAPPHFLPEILPGLWPPGFSQSLRPHGRGVEGAGRTVRVGSAVAEAHGACSPQQWPALWRAGQNGGTCRLSAARWLGLHSAGLGMRRPRPVHCT